MAELRELAAQLDIPFTLDQEGAGQIRIVSPNQQVEGGFDNPPSTPFERPLYQ